MASAAFNHFLNVIHVSVPCRLGLFQSNLEGLRSGTLAIGAALQAGKYVAFFLSKLHVC